MSSSGFADKVVKGFHSVIRSNETAVGKSITKFETNNSIDYCGQLDDFIHSITAENVADKRVAAVNLARGFKDDELLRDVNIHTVPFNQLIKELIIRQEQLQVFVDIHTEWQRYKKIKNPSQEAKVTVAKNIEEIITKGVIPFDRQPPLWNPEMVGDYDKVKSTLKDWARDDLHIKLNYEPDYRKSDYMTQYQQHHKARLKAYGVIEEFEFKLPMKLPKPQSSVGKVAGATGLPFFIAAIVLLSTTPPVGVLYCFGYALATAASAVAGWFLGGAIETGVNNSRWCQDDDSSPADDESPSPKSKKDKPDAADHQLSDSVQHHLARKAAPSPTVRQRKIVTFDESKEKPTSKASLSTPKTVSAAAKTLAKSKQAVSTAAIAVERAETVAGKSGQLNKNAGGFADMARQLKEKQARGSSWF